MLLAFGALGEHVAFGEHMVEGQAGMGIWNNCCRVGEAGKVDMGEGVLIVVGTGGVASWITTYIV